MTPEEFLAKRPFKQVAWVVGLGLPLAAAGSIGTRYAGGNWHERADDVLKAAMTPASVLAAAALVLLAGALADRRPDGEGANSRSKAIALVSITYLSLTTVYFLVGLATLSVPAGTVAKVELVSASFAWLGFVLGSMFSMAVLLVQFYWGEATGGPSRSGRADGGPTGEGGVEAEAGGGGAEGASEAQ